MYTSFIHVRVDQRSGLVRAAAREGKGEWHGHYHRNIGMKERDQ